jgi:hypothetical protein
MPRDSTGLYYLPTTWNPVVTGTVIESDWANGTLDDIAEQLNNVITRDGSLGPTGPFKFADGTAAAPGIAFSAAPGTGIYRAANQGLGFSRNGEQVFGMHNLGFSIPGQGKGIYADMTDPDVTKRFTGVTSIPNANTVFQIAPNGTGDPAGSGSAFLAISSRLDPANFYGLAMGAGVASPGVQRCAVRLYKVGTVPDVPLAFVIDDQVMMSMWEHSVITIGDHTPAAWGTTVQYELKMLEFGKPGWSIGANLRAADNLYALGTVCNGYSDGTVWRLAANSPYGAGKASAGFAICRGDQFIFGLNTSTATAAGSPVSWSPSVVVDWSTLGDNKLGVFGQVRAWQFVATDQV